MGQTSMAAPGTGIKEASGKPMKTWMEVMWNIKFVICHGPHLKPMVLPQDAEETRSKLLQPSNVWQFWSCVLTAFWHCVLIYYDRLPVETRKIYLLYSSLVNI